MFSRHCAKAASSFIIKTKGIGAKTLRYLNVIPNNKKASEKRGKENWPMAAKYLFAIKRQLYSKILNRNKGAKGRNIKPKVIHDKIAKRFYIVDDDGSELVYLIYQKKDDLIKIIHTEVPLALRGQGYGKLLAEEALGFVARNNYQLRIRCAFVRLYVENIAPKYLKYMK